MLKKSPLISVHHKKTPLQDDSFSNLVIRFFNGEKNLDLMPHTYSDFVLDGKKYSPAKLWDNLIKSDEYYLYRGECELFEKLPKKILSVANDADVIFDLGPGSANVVKNKTFKVLKFTKSLKAYIPVDVSKAFLDDVEKETRKQFGNFNILPVQDDIYNHRFTYSGKKPLHIFAGGTLMNIPMEYGKDYPIEAIKRLKKLKSGIGANGMLLIGYDANQDGKSATRAYNHPINNDFIMSFMYQIAANLNCKNYDPSGFHCKAEWDERVSCVKVFAQATKNQTFSISGNHFTLQKGEKFHIVSSFRFTPEKFEDMAKQAGFKPVTYIQDNDQRMTLHLLAI